jgi:hypothetical protein
MMYLNILFLNTEIQDLAESRVRKFEVLFVLRRKLLVGH